MTVIPIVIGALGTVTKGLVLWLEGLEKRGWEDTNYSIVEFGLNTESLGDLRRLALTQTPVRNTQITLVWKSLKK